MYIIFTIYELYNAKITTPLAKSNAPKDGLAKVLFALYTDFTFVF
jgi:hypothetical protein